MWDDDVRPIRSMDELAAVTLRRVHQLRRRRRALIAGPGIGVILALVIVSLVVIQPSRHPSTRVTTITSPPQPRVVVPIPKPGPSDGRVPTTGHGAAAGTNGQTPGTPSSGGAIAPSGRAASSVPTTAGAPAPATTPVSHAPRPIVFTRFMSPQNATQRSEIFIMNDDGSGLRALSTTPQYGDDAPSLSPDGKEVVFASRRNSIYTGLVSVWEIWVIDTDGTHLRQLTTAATDLQGAEFPSWSPDGKQIAFSGGENVGDIDVMNANGSDQHTVVAGLHAYGAEWSPDGSRLSFLGATGPSNAPNHVWLVNADGTDLRQVTTVSVGSCAPLWSPDGEWIAYDTYDISGATPTRVRLVHPDGSGDHPFDNAADGNEIDIAWSADGSEVVLASTPTTPNYVEARLGLFTPAGQFVRQITDPPTGQYDYESSFAP